MSEKHETVADIVAEMRGPKFYPWGQGGFSVEMDLTPLADRIEAAQKREVGNGAKMREALKRILKWFDDGGWDEDAEAEMDSMLEAAEAALAEPPRACDVLSANELKLQVFAGLAYQIKIKGLNIMGLELLLRSVAGAVIDIAYDTNEEGKTND